MSTFPMIYASNMNDQQRSLFYAQYALVQKDELLGVLLAVFLGSFGAHHFYLRRNGLGIFYCCLAITGISGLLGLIEAFFMPGRVRRFNAVQAQLLAVAINAAPTQPIAAAPVAPVVCPACGVIAAGPVNFCARCGAALSR